MFNVVCIFTASNMVQERGTRPTQILAKSVIPKKLKNNQGEY